MRVPSCQLCASLIPPLCQHHTIMRQATKGPACRCTKPCLPQVQRGRATHLCSLAIDHVPCPAPFPPPSCPSNSHLNSLALACPRWGTGSLHRTETSKQSTNLCIVSCLMPAPFVWVQMFWEARVPVTCGCLCSSGTPVRPTPPLC